MEKLETFKNYPKLQKPNNPYSKKYYIKYPVSETDGWYAADVLLDGYTVPGAAI